MEAAEVKNEDDADHRLAALGIELPTVSVPRGNYVPVAHTGAYLFVSGQGPRWNGELRYAGRVGTDLSVADGQEAAKLCALNIVSHLANACAGDLSRIARVVRVAGVVQSGPDFAEHATVLNGASDLFVEIFGERGKHARIATGASSLPSRMAVEVEAIFEIS
ncbi:RidA family protein [Saccharopolyspora spinosa]|uniref:RidA family protein n=1 Tax=Saccharopolyspora spinosa TaxID=60894 RepID=UPI00376EACF4